MPFSKYSPKQKKLARVAAPRNKITGADFKALKIMHRKLISVAKKLDKASKAHAGQSKTLKKMAKKKGGCK